MPNQTAVNVMAAVKREVASGTPAASGAGALLMRLLDSPGMKLARAQIQSAEHRADLLRPMGRLGGKSAAGTYNQELSSGGVTDMFIEALLRTVWVPAVVINGAAMGGGTFTTTVSTIVASAGSWLVAGVRVGDIVTITTDVTGANNNIRLRVVAVTALVLTVAGTPLTVNAVGRAIVVTILKKAINAANPIHYSHSIEQYDVDVDQSELFVGVKVLGAAFSFRPGAIATIAWTVMGMDRQVVTTAAAPYFTAPTETTGTSMIADDSAIRFNGADVFKFTGLDLNLQIAGTGQPVIGSFVTPDVFDNDLTITGSIMAVREDFSRLTMFDNETEFELSALFQEPGTAPLNALGFFLPRVKFGDLESPLRGGDGAKIETLPLMIAPKVAAAGYDGTAITILSSAP